jgi:zinc transporter ZupT
MTVTSFLFAAAFALVHIGIGWLRFLDRTPRSRWLSAAGGVAVTYIFLHVLPELAAHSATFARQLNTTEKAADGLVYSLSLAGLVVFYGLERVIKVSRQDVGHSEKGNTGAAPFWLHIGSFAIYNLIIGYLLLHREESGYASLLIYGLAMALHFVTNDFGLRQDHKARYDKTARWILAGAVTLGWLLGGLTNLPAFWVDLFFAFLAGAVVLNVLKEELPDERESRLWPFVGAVLAYAALLLAI